MSFNLATAKTRLGIVDPTKDALITAAINMSLSFAETYCSRKFMEQDDTETLVPVRSGVLSLRRYPLTTVNSLTFAHNGSAPTQWHLDKDAGLVYLDGFAVTHELTVIYHGGYATLPDDLEFALFNIFDYLWAATPGWGASIGTSSAGGGEIESITIPDVGSVKLSTAAKAAAGAASTGALGGAIPALAAGILDLYRREFA